MRVKLFNLEPLKLEEIRLDLLKISMFASEVLKLELLDIMFRVLGPELLRNELFRVLGLEILSTLSVLGTELLRIKL